MNKYDQKIADIKAQSERDINAIRKKGERNVSRIKSISSLAAAGNLEEAKRLLAELE